jgi:DNA-binding FadR family transcriptional regulator
MATEFESATPRSGERVELTRPAHLVTGYHGVVDVIRREMALGRLLPGQRLSAERKLAEQLGVARETIRQALRVLEASGQIAIERGPQGGPVVRETAMTDDAVLAELRARRDELAELFEFRIDIESAAARRAAVRHTSTHLAEMADAQRAMLDAGTRDVARAADTAFHLAVARAAGNGRLLRAVENARAEMFYPIDLVTFAFVKETSHGGHELVLAAIRDGTSLEAGEAMVTHLEQARSEVLAMIDGGDRTR